ncbi:hypothetical protein [Fusibacter tunisiensis]|uniref:Uncharacterized protein n=1 Tax=Fusibacter tunisiensis TaxID=1008308 RepID=A0ABS2MT58_9FIRM|nr:hypothetical protein [Fusibacter tunisiensis]MBM7562535.1 hypothetical protein [Fusibacter tunisiensis]
MSESKTRMKSRTRFALSIHMKYGEVLHVEGLTREEKDQYFDLARDSSRSVVVEDATSIRHIASTDIAKITVKPYDEQVEKIMLPVRKILFTESTLGRRLFGLLIKLFVAASVIGVIGVFGLAMIEGNIVDVFFEPELFSETLQKGLDFVEMLYGYVFVLMLLLALVDLVLGLREFHFINSDGEEAAENPRIMNLGTVIIFAIVFKGIVAVLSRVVGML